MMFSEFVEFIKSNEGAPPSPAEITHDSPSAIIGAAASSFLDRSKALVRFSSVRIK